MPLAGRGDEGREGNGLLLTSGDWDLDWILLGGKGLVGEQE